MIPVITGYPSSPRGIELIFNLNLRPRKLWTAILLIYMWSLDVSPRLGIG